MRAEDFGINIDKLSIVTDDAGKEFQAAVARSGGLPLSSRDGELEELRQIVVAKDRSISSLRSTLDGQRSALEGRIAQTEKILGDRDRELGAIRDELEGAMRAKAVAEAALKREVEVNRRSKEAIKSDLEDLRQKLRQASSEGMKVKANLRAEREKTERLRAELEQIFTREAMVTEQLQMESDAHKETQRKLENYHNEHVRDKENQAVTAASIHDDLQRRLEVERRGREASEQLLRAELKSREEMEYLLLALRDLVMNKKKPSPSGDNQEQIRLVKQELYMLRSEEERDMKQRREQHDMARKKLEGHQASLAAELAELRTTMEFLLFGTQRSDVQISRVRSEGNKESGEDTAHLMPSSPVSFVVPLRDR